MPTFSSQIGFYFLATLKGDLNEICVSIRNISEGGEGGKFDMFNLILFKQLQIHPFSNYTSENEFSHLNFASLRP